MNNFDSTTLSKNIVSAICYIGVYPELFLIWSISLLLAFFVIIDYIFSYKLILLNICGNLTVLTLVLYLILLNNNSYNFSSFNNLFIQNNFTIFIKTILTVSLIVCVLISYNYLEKEKLIQYEYWILLLLSFLGMITMISSNDLICLYIGIELQSLAFYILAAFKVHNNFSTEAGLKYFILGAFSSGLLLFGISLIYGFSGTTNFTDLFLLIDNGELPEYVSTGFFFGSLFITIGILFKLGAVPFHMWVPDVYQGVPTSVTAVFAIVPKVGLLSVLIRLSLTLFSNSYYFWHQIIVYCGVFSIVIGTLGALYQTKIKKLLAYSAISHIGFVLIGVGCLDSFSLFSLIFYITVYIVISLNIFAFLLALRKVDNNLKIKNINELAILFKSNKALGMNFCLILFSLAGIPPLAGFYSKYYIFVSAIKSDMYIVALIAAIMSVIASMYYLRLIKLMLFKNFDNWIFLQEVPKVNSMVLSITFFFNIFFFCYPEIVVITIYNIVLTYLY